MESSGNKNLINKYYFIQKVAFFYYIERNKCFKFAYMIILNNNLTLNIKLTT